MSLGPGHIVLFLLSGGLTVWGLAWTTMLGEADGYGIVIIGMVLLGAAGSVLSLLPLRDGTVARLRRLQRMQAEGLVSDDEAQAMRTRILG